MSPCPRSSFATPTRLNLALLLLRTASGAVFLYHGGGILFGAFGGPGPQQFAASHSWSPMIAYLVGLAQVGGALAILSGILFRFGAAAIVVVMLGAILLVHIRHGFDVSSGGAEYALVHLLLAIALLLTGSGEYSVGRWLPIALRKW